MDVSRSLLRVLMLGLVLGMGYEPSSVISQIHVMRFLVIYGGNGLMARNFCKGASRASQLSVPL
jgi:hypothetical protein